MNGFVIIRALFIDPATFVHQCYSFGFTTVAHSVANPRLAQRHGVSLFQGAGEVLHTIALEGPQEAVDALGVHIMATPRGWAVIAI